MLIRDANLFELAAAVAVGFALNSFLLMLGVRLFAARDDVHIPNFQLYGNTFALVLTAGILAVTILLSRRAAERPN